ncbi:MAG TPA: ABC transporter substrate-binding protein, partial [Minicystis sp.]|nr:ABC transporter substrate-binding protein [Minicystis sp.]
MALFAGIGVVGSSCSLIIDKNGDQCQADGDCSSFAGTTCQAGVCTPAMCTVPSDCAQFSGTICKDGQCLPASEGCQSNADCSGSYTICRKDTGSCVALQTKECPVVLGDWQNDNAVVLGGIMPLDGPDKTTGQALLDSVKLALGDFQRVNNLPPAPSGSGQRPIVVVACNDGSDTDTAETAAKHLVDDVGVGAIIGCAFSGITISVATDVTIPGGTLLFSMSATSTAITSLDDHGLVWRTSPSDVYQAAALKQYVPKLEDQIRTARGLMPTDKIKLTVLYKGDAYGTGLYKALVPTDGKTPVITINGAPVTDPSNSGFFSEYDYGNPDDPKSDPTKYPQRVAEVLTDQPDIVLVFGTNEGVTQVFQPIENQWVAGNRPLWVFSDGGEIKELWDGIKGNDSLRQRVTGTVPGTNGPLFQSFRSAYLGSFTDGTSPDVFGTAGSYDITYLLAYSAVALGDQPLTGANFNSALSNFFESGMTIDA